MTTATHPRSSIWTAKAYTCPVQSAGMSAEPEKPTAALHRVVGVPGAVLMGLGSILGTGIFVSIGIAAGIAGPSVILAVALAAVVATINGLSSAQLAASHPVSGGTYEYGYRYLTPALGFTAGWMFLCAKSASAATAALGFAGYLLTAVGRSEPFLRVGVGLAVVAVLTLVVAGGMHRSNRVNTVIVSTTLLGLVIFVAAGSSAALSAGAGRFTPFFNSEEGAVSSLLYATALMFVAYTGYGRIATLGEEIHRPERNIPRAIITTLVITMILYVTVTAVAIGVAGSGGLAGATAAAAAPLEVVVRSLPMPGVSWIVGIAAVTAMAGVLLNLLLGLSRVLLAMGRRGDMPQIVARIDQRRASPTVAVIVIGTLIGGLVLTGSVKATWSFSAFTVLVYYALTNLAALRLPADQRLYPRWIPMCGLASCLGLAFWVDPVVWLTGLALIAIGLLWSVARRRRHS